MISTTSSSSHTSAHEGKTLGGKSVLAFVLVALAGGLALGNATTQKNMDTNAADLEVPKVEASPRVEVASQFEEEQQGGGRKRSSKNGSRRGRRGEGRKEATVAVAAEKEATVPASKSEVTVTANKPNNSAGPGNGIPLVAKAVSFLVLAAAFVTAAIMLSHSYADETKVEEEVQPFSSILEQEYVGFSWKWVCALLNVCFCIKTYQDWKEMKEGLSDDLGWCVKCCFDYCWQKSTGEFKVLCGMCVARIVDSGKVLVGVGAIRSGHCSKETNVECCKALCALTFACPGASLGVVISVLF